MAGTHPCRGERLVVDEPDLGETVQHGVRRLLGTSRSAQRLRELGPGARRHGQQPQADRPRHRLRVGGGPWRAEDPPGVTRGGPGDPRARRVKPGEPPPALRRPLAWNPRCSHLNAATSSGSARVTALNPPVFRGSHPNARDEPSPRPSARPGSRAQARQATAAGQSCPARHPSRRGLAGRGVGRVRHRSARIRRHPAWAPCPPRPGGGGGRRSDPDRPRRWTGIAGEPAGSAGTVTGEDRRRASP